MIIWGALLIPVVTAVVLLLLFRHKTLWWEMLIPIAASFVLIGICKVAISVNLTLDTEWWGGYVVKAQYFERWNEYIFQICTREYPCGTDSEGHTIYCTETYDCSYVENHPPQWHVIDNNGIDLSVDESTYERLVRKFGAEPAFVDMHRDYHTRDGDLYEAYWGEDDETLEPMTTEHWYENKVAVSQSVYTYPEIDEETVKQYQLFDYPKISGFYDMQCIFGDGDSTQERAEKELRVWNGKLGRSKQVRMNILIFKNQPLLAAHSQEAYWEGGNKNEFNVAIGVNDAYHITWAHAFSWTEIEGLKIETRNYVNAMDTLNLATLVGWLHNAVEQQFVRKHFSDFDYLTVEPPAGGIIFTYLFTLLVNIGVSYWVVRNEFCERELGEQRSARRQW